MGWGSWRSSMWPRPRPRLRRLTEHRASTVRRRSRCGHRRCAVRWSTRSLGSPHAWVRLAKTRRIGVLPRLRSLGMRPTCTLALGFPTTTCGARTPSATIRSGNRRCSSCLCSGTNVEPTTWSFRSRRVVFSSTHDSSATERARRLGTGASSHRSRFAGRWRRPVIETRDGRPSSRCRGPTSATTPRSSVRWRRG